MAISEQEAKQVLEDRIVSLFRIGITSEDPKTRAAVATITLEFLQSLRQLLGVDEKETSVLKTEENG